jgi:DNA-binding transcriptional LysR family regulator
VARNSSISRAAEEINLSQPAVTQAIAKVEGLVGRSLFGRRQNGTFLTRAGEVYLHRVQRFLRQCEGILADANTNGVGASSFHNLTNTQIRSLLATSRSLSFSESARSIGISTASLQRAAREFEANVGTPVYRPSKFGITLTEAGQEIARKMGLALGELQAAEDDLRFLDGVEGGRVALGTLPLSGSYMIGSVISELTRDFPEAKVSIISGPYDLLLNHLRSGTIDLIFGILRRPPWATDILEEPLFYDPYCLVARPDHPLASHRDIQLHDMLAFEWIAPNEGTPRRREFDALFEGTNHRPVFNIETSSMATIRAVLASSDRLTLVSHHEVEADERSNLLAVLPWVSSLPPMAKGITVRADWLPTPIQERFFTIVRDHALTADKTAQQNQKSTP